MLINFTKGDNSSMYYNDTKNSTPLTKALNKNNVIHN